MTVDAVPRSATVKIAADAATDQRTQKRLQEHVTLLQSLGVPGLANLGTLRISGSVAPRPGLTLPSATKQAAAIPGDTAYWVASAIDLAPDTNVILKQPCGKLTIIAEKVTVGARVAFTWEQPGQSEPPSLPKPAKRPQAPTPRGPQGVAGEAGSD